MDKLPDTLARKLTRLGSKLIDQQRGQVLVQPTEDADGFWFGGGNCVRDPRDGSLLLIGLIVALLAGIAVWLETILVLFGPRELRFEMMTLKRSEPPASTAGDEAHDRAAD